MTHWVNSSVKYKISSPPYDENTHKITPDYYFNGVENYELVIINVYEKSEAEQLFNLITKAHDHGIKIIVLIESRIKFIQLINKVLNDYLKSGVKQRRTDRFKMMFPGFL